MAYATVTDVQVRLTDSMTPSQLARCAVLLEDAAVLIDATGTTAGADVKVLVSCRMVARMMGDGDRDVPLGANQGSMTALGYTQQWSMGGSGSVGELYLSKTEKRLLGVADRIGSYSPVQELAGGDAL